MLFTSGPDRAFERLMQEKPGFDHYDSGGADAPEDCGTCRFYRPDWKYQFCQFAECPYQPGKLTDYAAVKFTVKGANNAMAVFRVEKNKGYTVMSNHHLRNKNLTLKAKGLLSQMLSLPEDWDYYRKHGTLDGCPHLTEKGIENLKADMASGWHYEKKPFQSWQLSNNNAEIRRLKGRIEELTRQKEAAYVGWEFDGGTVEINREANRLQIFFEGKPDAAVRDELKSNGFRWSPKAEAWQRQLNDTTIRVADRIKCIQPLSGEKPSALQLAARREKEKPSIRAQLNAAKAEQAKQPPAREKSKGLEVE